MAGQMTQRFNHASTDQQPNQQPLVHSLCSAYPACFRAAFLFQLHTAFTL
jgi:hypothetical protein